MKTIKLAKWIIRLVDIPIIVASIYLGINFALHFASRTSGSALMTLCVLIIAGAINFSGLNSLFRWIFRVVYRKSKCTIEKEGVCLKQKGKLFSDGGESAGSHYRYSPIFLIGEGYANQQEVCNEIFTGDGLKVQPGDHKTLYLNEEMDEFYFDSPVKDQIQEILGSIIKLVTGIGLSIVTILGLLPI